MLQGLEMLSQTLAPEPQQPCGGFEGVLLPRTTLKVHMGASAVDCDVEHAWDCVMGSQGFVWWAHVQSCMAGSCGAEGPPSVTWLQASNTPSRPSLLARDLSACCRRSISRRLSTFGFMLLGHDSNFQM